MVSTPVEREIGRFLRQTRPEVLCIRGRWGIGKTFAWEEVLGSAAHSKLPAENYAYVSLFGLNSIAEVRQAVFESTIKVSEFRAGPSPRTLQERIAEILGRGYRQVSTRVSEAALVRDYFGALPSILHLAIRNQIICFDDLERRGEGLRVKDLLGLASHLHQKRDCRVCIILNDDALDGDQSEFLTHSEKVIDRSIQFVGDPASAADIALSLSSCESADVREAALALKITNIRTIVKTIWFLKRAEAAAGVTSKVVRRDICRMLMLAVWAGSEPGSPSLDFIKKRARDLESYVTAQTDKLSGDEKEWDRLLKDYEVSSFDKIDEILLDGVQSGYFDEENLAKEVRLLEAKSLKLSKAGEFQEVIRMFLSSFGNNEDYIVEKIEKIFARNKEFISVNQINAAVDILKRLGKRPEALKMLDSYFEQDTLSDSYINVDDLFFGFSQPDEDLLERVQSINERHRHGASPTQLIPKVLMASSWRSKELSDVAAFSIEEYARVFRTLRGSELGKCVRGGLAFLEHDRTDVVAGSADEKFGRIGRNTREALKAIGSESKIDRARVEAFGVSMNSSPP